MTFETILSISLGLGLAAACGFRIFVPLLAMSIANHAGHLELADGFSWIGSTPALVALAVATALEIGAYYVPWLDNFLDTAATPLAVVAGIVVTASVVTDMSPILRWSLAAIAGGGVAATVQASTTAIRGFSSLATLGLGNASVSTAEMGGAATLSLAAILAPLFGLVLVLAVLVAIGMTLRWLRSKTPTVSTA